MNERETQPEQKTLELWLKSATRDLCSEASARIRAEITQHVDSACESFREQGMHEFAAFHKVLDSLGSPEAARARYTKTNLTWSEQLLLDSVRFQTKALKWILILFIPCGVALLFAFYGEVGWVQIGQVLVMLFFSICWVAFVQFANRKPRQIGDKLRISALIAFWIIFAVGYFFRAIIDQDRISLLSPIFFGFLAVIHLPLAKKLWRETAK